MSTGGSSKTTPVMNHWSKIVNADKGHHAVCVEFKQARDPFNWRKYMCNKCGALRGKHCVCKAKTKADDNTGIKEEHLPPRKRLMLRYKREKKALAAAASTAREKGKEEGLCMEFNQAKYPFNWRKYMCDKCGALRGKHCICKAKAKVDDDTGIKEEHLPPRKRLMLRYKREQKALAAASAAKEGKERQLELEERETTWIPGATTTKGKRAPRRRRT
jgi:hypothetical protein